jgi:hypothetical protein
VEVAHAFIAATERPTADLPEIGAQDAVGLSHRRDVARSVHDVAGHLDRSAWHRTTVRLLLLWVVGGWFGGGPHLGDDVLVAGGLAGVEDAARACELVHHRVAVRRETASACSHQ